MNVEWNFYDAKLESQVSKRNLPHIDMNGCVTFVTFRLADSMPKHVVEAWHNELESWLNENGLSGRSVEEILQSSNVAKSLKGELRQFKHRRWHSRLDDCHGACFLLDEQTRKSVSNSLLHFNGQRYDLDCFVIMPNHVHVLIQMRPEYPLRKQLTSILRFSGREANAHLNLRGEFWQSEPFDHVVRSESQFEYLQRYIAENPLKAGLPEGDYTLWARSC
jgi:type I restriction enzyme R subunit